MRLKCMKKSFENCVLRLTNLNQILLLSKAAFDWRILISRLKSMARELPVDYQQRVPYELLTELASSLAQVRHFY